MARAATLPLPPNLIRCNLLTTHLSPDHFRNSTICIPGSEVIPVPLFVPLDGTNSEDYVARVEPSASGGKKVAKYLLQCIRHSPSEVTPMYRYYSAPPTTTFVADR
jgi:hypothetical protein